MTRKPWFSQNEIVRLSLMGYDSLYRVDKVLELPNGRSSVKSYGYKLSTCMDNKPVVYGEQALNVFNESLLLKAHNETWMTFPELIHYLKHTDFTLESEDE